MTLALPEVQAFVYEEKENGSVVQTYRYFVCRSFKGMKRAGDLPKCAWRKATNDNL